MKHQEVIRKLIKAAIISGVASVIFVVAYHIVAGYVEDLQQTIQVKSGELISIQNNHIVAEKGVGEVNQAYKYYLEFSQSSSSRAESFRRDNANRMLAQVGEDLGIDQVFLSMTQFKEVGGAFKRENVGLYAADLTVQFMSFTDFAAYNMLKRLGEVFPGSIVVQSFSFAREEYSTSALVSLSEERKKGMVAGNIAFKWRGVQENEKIEPEITPAQPAIGPDGQPINPAPGADPYMGGGMNAPMP